MLGSIIFVRTSSPISWLIRKLTRSKYSHVCLSVSQDNNIILEADIFKQLKIKKCKYKTIEVVDVFLNDSQRLQLLYFILSKYEAKYDYYYVLGMGLKLLGFIKDSNPFDRRNRWMCSEIIDEAFKHVRIDLLPNERDGDVTPSQLARVLLKEK